MIQNKLREYGICEGSDCIDIDIPCSQAMLITRDIKRIFEINLLEANTNPNHNYVIHDDDNILHSRINLDFDDIIMNEQYYVSHNANNDIRVLIQFLLASNGFDRFETYKGKWDLIDIDNGNKCRICNVGKHLISTRNMRQLPSYQPNWSLPHSKQSHSYDEPTKIIYVDKRYM